MSDSDRPRLVKGAAIGAISTAFLAGPVLFCIIVVLELFRDPDLRNLSTVISTLPVALPLASIFGLFGALPAAIVNATVLALATKCKFDGWLLALLCGALCGITIAPVGLRMFAYRDFSRYWNGGEDSTQIIICFGATGALMGLIHWLIAIRRLRNWRLAASRSAME